MRPEIEEIIADLKREASHDGPCSWRLHCVDALNWQAARIAELEAALKPFARVADWDISDSEPDKAKYIPMDGRYAVGGVLKIGDFRRALAALEKDRTDG